MTIKDILITGRTAKLRGESAPQVTEAEVRHAAQFCPGGVTPAAEAIEGEFCLELPFPPSMNAYWGLKVTAKGRWTMVVTPRGKAYQKLVRSLVALRWRRPTIDYRIAVLIEAWAPSEDYAPGGRWEWDVDNRVKPLQDALAKAAVIKNDKLIRDVRIVDRGILPPGRVIVWIRRFSGN